MSSFILVLHPHQRPGEAYAFHSNQALIDAWVNGTFKDWHADNSSEIGDRAATFDDAISDIAHDLHLLTFIESKERCEEWLSGKIKAHNFPYQSVWEEAKLLGWIDRDDEDQEDEEEKANANKWQVWIGLIYHSSHSSYRSAVDQADMIQGEVRITATHLSDYLAWALAVANQGCELSWKEWKAQDDDEREEWELGAQGIGTV